MKPHGTKESWLAALRTEGAAFRSAAKDAELTVPVPSCPGWTALGLVHHLGGVYHWVRSHASRGITSPPDPGSRLQTSDLPSADAALDWFAGEFSALVELLDALDPQMPAWNWAPQAKTALFWHRRMAHETAVHRWDLQMAIGRAEPIEARLAVDGVTEVLDSWLPAGRRKGPTDVSGVVRLDATDTDIEWYVRLRGEGVALLDTDTLLDDHDPGARASAAGHASDLMLALYGRVGFDVLDVHGDEHLLESLRTG